MADWDSMYRVITQTRFQAFQTLCRAFETLKSLKKLRVFDNLVC